MSYTSLYFKKSKKPLFVLGALSILSLFLGSYFFVGQIGRKNGWQTTSGIQRVYIVNRSPHGFEVIWSNNKNEKEDQWVEVTKEKENQYTSGTFDTFGGVNRAIIGGLEANTRYRFRIRVGSKTYILPHLLSDIIQTPKEEKENPTSPAYGKAILPSTKPYANGLLIYEIDGYYPLAVFTKETGEWLLPLTGLVEKKSNSIVSIADRNLVSIKLFSYPEGIIRTSVGQTRPLRKVMIAGTSSLPDQITQTKGESILGVNSQNNSITAVSTSSITYPKENAIIPGNAPLIRGRASIGGDVLILIKSSTKQYSYRTKADEKGDWLVRYPLVLDPGRYSILATMKNDRGTSTITQRSFNIIKSGEQVMGIATGTPTLVPTVSLLISSNPTVIPTESLILPTDQVSQPTLLPTRLVPTASPPVTGGGMNGFLFGALFCIVIGAGLVLAF